MCSLSKTEVQRVIHLQEKVAPFRSRDDLPGEKKFGRQTSQNHFTSPNMTFVHDLRFTSVCNSCHETDSRPVTLRTGSETVIGRHLCSTESDILLLRRFLLQTPRKVGTVGLQYYHTTPVPTRTEGKGQSTTCPTLECPSLCVLPKPTSHGRLYVILCLIRV